MELLKKIGVGIVEPLKEFAELYGIETNKFDHIYIAHRNSSKRSRLLTSSDNRDPFPLDKIPDVATHSHDVKTSFKPKRILLEIIRTFRCNSILSYLFSECYILYETSGGFETLIKCDLNGRLNQRKIEQRKRKREENSGGSPTKKPRKIVSDKSDVNLSVLGLLKWPKRVSEKEVTSGEEYVSSFPTDSIKATVCLDSILYQLKQRRRVLNVSRKGIMHDILHTPFGIDVPMLSEWEIASKNWTIFSRILEHFIACEAELSDNNGYYRYLRGSHLMKNHRRGERVPANIVYSHICHVVRRVLPSEFFGSNRQRKNFLKEVGRLVHGVKHQKFSLLPFLDCFLPYPPWFEEVAPYYQKYLLVMVTKYLLENFILKVLNSMYFVTESGSTSFELIYFIKGEFESAVALYINSLVTMGEIELSTAMEKKKTKDGWSALEIPGCKTRFLPKNPSLKELRMITIRKNRAETEQTHVIKTLKIFLDCILQTRRTGIRPQATNPQLHEAWRKVVDLQRSGSKLYFVKADIRHAFRSVVHEKLFKIIDSWCPDSSKNWREIELEEWALRFGEIWILKRKSFTRGVARGRILISRKFSPGKGFSSASMKDALRQLITLQNIEVRSKTYHVLRGLCQGGLGTLSNRLCDIYYSAMDRKVFKDLINCPDTVFLRAVDDYLLVSTDLEKATGFLKTVNEGVAEFNINFGKIVSNVSESAKVFTYLGICFNIEDLSCRPNFRTAIDPIKSIKFCVGPLDPAFSKGYFFNRKVINSYSLRLLPFTVDNEWCSLELKHEVLNEICGSQAFKLVELAIFMRIDCRILLKTLHRLLGKILMKTRTLQKQWVEYIYWQNIYKAFRSRSGSFSKLHRVFQLKLIQLHLSIKKLTSPVPLMTGWWNPEKKKSLGGRKNLDPVL